MAINNPPKYRYSFFEEWDREAFETIKNIAKTNFFPQITGSKKDKNQFLTTLIRTQKSLNDWRDFLKDTLDQIKSSGTINTKELNERYPPESIGKNVPEWVTYEEDKIVSNFIDELETRRIDFIGEDKEISEFVLRFILGQLGHDWEQTIMMIWELLGNENKVYLKALNEELKNFDYLKIFNN